MFSKTLTVDMGQMKPLSFMCKTSLDRDGDLALFNSLLGTADVNHVSESLHGIKLVALSFTTCLTDLKGTHLLALR